jgi:hypothetical protein
MLALSVSVLFVIAGSEALRLHTTSHFHIRSHFR